MPSDVFLAAAVNQPKGTKNESNSQQLNAIENYGEGCKSTQRYKERKQFTTTFDSNVQLAGCKSTQRYKERKQFTTDMSITVQQVKL